MAAARETVVLSSSPPRTIPDSDIVVTPPSLRDRVPTSPPSPELPSLPDLLKSRPNGLKSGTRAAEIPDGATLGFGSVGSLLKSKQISLRGENSDDLPEAPVEKKTTPKRIKGVRKPRASAPDHDETDQFTDSAARAGEKNGGRANKKDKATNSRPPRTKKAKDPDAAGTGGMKIAYGNSKDPADVTQESSAVGALKKRRARPTAQVLDFLSVQVGVRSTEDLPAATEPAVAAHDLPHGSEVLSSIESLEGAQNTASDEAIEVKSGNASRSRRTRQAPSQKTQVKRAPRARKATSAVSTHFSRENSRDSGKDQLPYSPKDTPNDAPLDLDRAVERRRSWTPRKDTSSKMPIEPVGYPSEPLVSSGQRANQDQFASLLDGFGYQKIPQDADKVEVRADSGEAFTKRRKLQMIPNPVSTAAQTAKKAGLAPGKQEKPAKEKAPAKKKPKTITELATAAYRASPMKTTAEVDSRVSDFFAPRSSGPPPQNPNEAESAPPGRPKRARAKSPSKASVEKAKKATEKARKQAELAANKLLSPGAALIKYNNQEVLFGTSSQLVREESPTFVRQIRQALRESEAAPMLETSLESLHSRPVPGREGSSLLGERNSLWAASARNLVDESFDVYDPAAEDFQPAGGGPCSPFLEDTANGEAHPSAQPQDQSSGFVDIDEYDDLTKQYNEASATFMNADLPIQTSPRPSIGPPAVRKRQKASQRTVLSHTVPRHSILPLHRSPSPKELNGARAMSTLTMMDRVRAAVPTAEESMTSRETLTTLASLSAAWKGKKAPQALPQGLVVIPNTLSGGIQVPDPRNEGHIAIPKDLPQGLITPSKTARRKSAKQGEDRVHIDEIEDSEEEVTPSPSRRRKVPSTSPKLRLTAPGEDGDAAPMPAATRASTSKRVSSVPSDEQLAEVFPMITDAIKADPPSVQPGTPTWHEQILLYDPIVVEDLSKWLNNRGIRILVKVAVKERKTKKKRSGEAKVDRPDDAGSGDEATGAQSEKLEVKEVPLQPWVVQRWCEEHSVCCVWKDTEQKRKGWKARSG